MSGAAMVVKRLTVPYAQRLTQRCAGRFTLRFTGPLTRRFASALLRTSLVCAFALGAGVAQAHKGSDAYLDVQEISEPVLGASAAPGTPAQRNFHFSLSVAIKDLDLLVPVDANADGKVTWGEVKAATPLLLALANEAVNLEPPPGLPATAANAAAACRLNWQTDRVERRSDGVYMRFAAQARCPATQAIALRYVLLKDQDATHRLLVAGRVAGKDLLTTTSPLQSTALMLGTALITATPAPTAGSAGSAAAAATADSATAAAPASVPVGHPTGTAASGRWQALRDYFALGAHHLLEGYDHLAFLLALVLPLRLNLRSNSLRANANANAKSNDDGRGNVWWALLRTITAFTIGHSITLVLATFGLTQASAAWVEPVIALSIGVTALLNLRPVPWLRVDVLALLFGMVHGFGFAGLLLEAAAPSGLLPWALAGFNLGVEAGQLMAVSAWVLLSQLFVARAWYGSVVVRGGSVLLILLAAFWFFQRVG